MEVRPGSKWMCCGSHIGTVANQLIHKGAREVETFECDPDTLILLRANVKKNGNEGRVKIRPKAIGINRRKREKNDLW